MPDPRKISIEDYAYELPADKIALRPLEKRDASRLLVYNNGIILDSYYKDIAANIPPQSLLIFNNSKVINARIKFQKPTGGIIEIFCLEPFDGNEYNIIMNQTGSSTWKCLVGGAGKWKTGILTKQLKINNANLTISVEVVSRMTDSYIVQFRWNPPQFSFADVIEAAGEVPLPPYIKREREISDSSRYQTIYALNEGSVAAPTAGLHFTEDIFDQLASRGIAKEYVTLHIGAGTFKPVKAETMQEHEMHAEWIDVSLQTIKNIRDHDGMIIAVGTTSLRTIETLYWIGVKIILDPSIEFLALKQWDIYEPPMQSNNVDVKDSFDRLISWMEIKKLSRLFLRTQLLIIPGYKFKVAEALITNFHQPRSTLLLLVAAAIGKDWEKIYEHALMHEYRFLSYGDGNLIFLPAGNYEM